MKLSKILIYAISLISLNTEAATISWSDLNPSNNLNDIFTLDVQANGFTSNVDGGGVNFSFDASILSVISVSIDESIWDFGSTGISTGKIDNINGTVNNIMVNAISNVTGNFTVASVRFQVVGEGSSLISLTEFNLNPWASGGNTITPNFVNATFTSPVPVPTAIWLFGSGLLGLIGVARTKARN